VGFCSTIDHTNRFTISSSVAKRRPAPQITVSRVTPARVAHLSSLRLFLLGPTGSERPHSGFVTKEITTGINSSHLDSTCDSVDTTACDFVTHPQQQLLVSIASASSRCKLSSSPHPSSSALPPSLAHFAGIASSTRRQVARINADQIYYRIVGTRGHCSHTDPELHYDSSAATQVN
jgi:hypothetical protein